MSKIKRLNEYFSQTLTGSGFNSSNGVFKVSYHAYRDMSAKYGPNFDPSNLVKDYHFKVGDLVKGNAKGLKNKIIGEIVSTIKAEDGKSSIIKAKSIKTQKIFEMIPGTMTFYQDRGNIKNASTPDFSTGEKIAQNARYSGGNVVWGSLESKEWKLGKSELLEDENGMISGPLGTGYKFMLSPEDNAETRMEDKCIHVPKPGNMQDLSDYLKSIEAETYFCNHPELGEYEDIIKKLLAIFTLLKKNESGAYKILVSKFPEKNEISYGEAKDSYGEQAYKILDNFV